MNKPRPEDVEPMEESGFAADDPMLVERARAGDSAAWADLHHRFYPGLRSSVTQIVQDQTLAEDIVQEAFIRAFRQISHFRGDSKFSTWLYRIAVNQAFDALRKKSRRQKWLGWLPLYHDHDDQPIHDVAIPENSTTDLARADQRDAIARALDSLKPEQRAVVELRLIRGFSTEETAKILGCKRGTVLSRLYYACQKLQKTLKHTHEEL
jgi:RNA polymerase sigma-70 factor (ECF subfamily)